MHSPSPNDPCPCGSGRKAKNCCHRPGAPAGRGGAVTIAAADGTPAQKLSPAEAISLAQDLHEGGDREGAERIYRLVLEADPENGEALFFTGVLRHQEKRYDEALELMRRGLAKVPGAANLHYNIGKLYDDLERYPEAIAAYRRAIEINPKHALAHNNLGLALRDVGQLDEAIECLERAVRLRPESQTLIQNLISTMNYVPSLDGAAIFKAHRELCALLERPIARFAPRPRNVPPRPLRIGYVSGDFRRHSVAHFIEPVLARHDPSRVEVFCYYNDTVEDEVTQRLKSLSPHWCVIGGMNDHDAARKIRDDDIDLLVDLAGHTNQNSLLMFARKPAPVQATWIGYPNTTGFTNIDYRITDALCDPPGAADALHTEQLMRLPDCFSCFQPPADSPEVGSLPALKAGAIMFGSFNYFIKMNHDVIETWARILKRVPASRLTLKYRSLNSESIQAVVHEAFAKHGVARERLVLMGTDESQRAHLDRYNSIDIALDPFPYNGTTTTCDALWMGVPVITLAGDRHAGRVGVSQLTNTGLPELVAKNRDEYVEIAATLAGDLPRLAALRKGLRRRLADSPLMDAERFTRNLERAYQTMWEAHLAEIWR
ncbi:MAG: tetratricopeptide repeat protein [Planctomycetes bacterium]|nr:tetratricopeptide repeat protein [Planctomycetota bacterium]